jgi:molybdopterin molybdotransferase
MLSVAEALQLLTHNVTPLPAETVSLAEAAGRILAEDCAARLTQPPFDSSAMDGYAVRIDDLVRLPAKLRITGVSAAGHPFGGGVGEGEAVRVFTGAVVPQGADYIIIQENTTASGDSVEIREINEGSSIRARGADFVEGQILIGAGKRLTPRDLMLAAQMNHPILHVRRRPLAAIIASGDELVPPGGTLQPGQIISSIPTGLAALLTNAGAEARRMGIAKDTLASLGEHIAAAADADLLVTIGGASVGDHDLVRQALEGTGFTIGFHKVAMRPGKPIMYGTRGAQRVVGLPGNPISAMMCAYIFLLPLIVALLGETGPESDASMLMPLAVPLPANGPRQHYMRAKIIRSAAGVSVAPLPSQDSSLTAAFAGADCLIVSPPNSPPSEAGAMVRVLPLSL